MVSAENYLHLQSRSFDKWRHYVDALANSNKMSYRETLVPFFGTPFFEKLSQAEREDLFRRMVQFNCEGVITFELLFLYSGRATANELQDPKERAAMLHFVREEFYHTKGFRRFLAQEFPRSSLVLKEQRLLRWVFARLMDLDPVCVMIPGLKSETYSIFYSRYIEEGFAGEDNALVELHKLHMADEALHIQIDYQFIESLIRGRSLLGRMKFFASTWLMIAAVQFIVLQGLWRIVKHTFPRANFLQKTAMHLRLVHWSLWGLEPYRQTRVRLAQQAKKRGASLYRAFNMGKL